MIGIDGVAIWHSPIGEIGEIVDAYQILNGYSEEYIQDEGININLK